uniref:Essential MCU regulator, mitochondrial n=1 Tax=Romanomermis culicivorax TaxID=13658 RepID=A0A915IIN3_ROMCU
MDSIFKRTFIKSAPSTTVEFPSVGLKPPTRVRFGLLKALIVISLGVFTGALLAKTGAAVLSESNIFNPQMDDDDD